MLALAWLLSARETLCQVTKGESWTAFVRRVEYDLLVDADESVWSARSLDGRTTWVALDGADAPLFGSMEQRGARHLRIPAPARRWRSCRR